MSSAPIAPASSAGASAQVDRETTKDDRISVLARRVLPILQLGAVFAVLVRAASWPLTNNDTYFHLRFGREFLTSWSIRDPGSVSTFATADWVPTQWLPQIAMARTEEVFGLAGVAWLQGLLLLTLALTFYVAARRWAPPVVASSIVILALTASITGLSMRPQVLSYIFAAVTAALWLRASETHRTPWVLVPMTWLWASCHGMWPTGVVIGFAAVVGLALDRRGASELVRHAAVPVASGLAGALLTPVGPALFPAVLTVSSRAEFFSEWSATDFASLPGVAVLILLGTTVVVMLRGERPSWTRILLLGLAAAWAAYSLRTLPVAAALLVPLVAATLGGRMRTTVPMARREGSLVAAMYAVALATLVVTVPPSSAAGLHEPGWLEGSLSTLPEGTKVLNDDGLGAYLMWTYPHLDLMMHGYGDTFTTAELERNRDLQELAPGWDDAVRDAGPTLAVLRPDEPLTYALTLQGWTQIDRDNEAVVLQAPADWFTRPAAEPGSP